LPLNSILFLLVTPHLYASFRAHQGANLAPRAFFHYELRGKITRGVVNLGKCDHFLGAKLNAEPARFTILLVDLYFAFYFQLRKF
jgi:hypothetical protein